MMHSSRPVASRWCVTRHALPRVAQATNASVTRSLARVSLGLFIVLAACGSEKGRESFNGDQAGTLPASSGGTTSNGSSGSLGTTAPSNAAQCAGNSNAPGCACASAGEKAPCWTGPANLRTVGACKDGTTTCEGQGEFSAWGACTGEVLPGSKNVDAQCLSTCKGECVPGKVRWCDHPTTCNWAKQECLPNAEGGGNWGQCIETKDIPSECKSFFTGSPIAYDEECCLKSNECCQVGGIGSAKSDGNCAGITVNCN